MLKGEGTQGQFPSQIIGWEDAILRRQVFVTKEKWPITIQFLYPFV